jgi:hypothetical protein
VVAGVGLPGPEFGLLTTATAIGRANFANALIFSNGVAADPDLYGSTGTSFDLSGYQSVAGDATALADRLDRNLLAGTMSAAMRQAIAGAVNALPATDSLNRARTALYLVVSSPQYQVQR